MSYQSHTQSSQPFIDLTNTYTANVHDQSLHSSKQLSGSGSADTPLKQRRHKQSSHTHSVHNNKLTQKHNTSNTGSNVSDKDFSKKLQAFLDTDIGIAIYVSGIIAIVFYILLKVVIGL